MASRSDKSDKSDRSDNAPHRTLRQNQTVFQYWGVSVIPLVASDFTGSAVSGERGASASLPQAPSLAAEVAHQSGATIILF